MSERARLAVGEAMEREHRVSERVMRCSGVRVLVVREVVTSGGKGKSVKGASHRKDAGKEFPRPPSAMMLAHCVSLAYDDMQVHIRYIRSNNIIRHHRLPTGSHYSPSHPLQLPPLTCTHPQARSNGDTDDRIVALVLEGWGKRQRVQGLWSDGSEFDHGITQT